MSLEVPVTVAAGDPLADVHRRAGCARVRERAEESAGAAAGVVTSMTVMLGDAARFMSVPAGARLLLRLPGLRTRGTGAVAPGRRPLVSPYVIVKVEPPPSVSDETVIVWPATVTVPRSTSCSPRSRRVDGALQPAGSDGA